MESHYNPALGLSDRSYSIGRPIGADWLDTLNQAVVANLPEHCRYTPLVQPGINYISRRNIDEAPCTVFDDCNSDEAEEIVEDVLSKLNVPWGELAAADTNLRIERYRTKERFGILLLELTIYDRLYEIERERIWRIESEKVAIRERLGFSSEIGRKPGKKPVHWVKLGELTIQELGVTLDDIRSAVVPYLPRNPVFSGVSVLHSS